jgi:hypothetical protein
MGFIARTLAVLILGCWLNSSLLLAELRVGAAKVDVTPDQLPVLINGGMTSRSVDQVKTRINARAIVIDDESERIALVVVDSCMMPRELLDEAKQLASTRTQLRPDRIMISATHAHSVPSSMGALGTSADPNYVPLLRQRLVEAVQAAEANLQPAQVGWNSQSAPDFTALRRWVRRPDRLASDPFGNPTVRANMHAGRIPEDAIGPTGPEDPELSMILFQTPEGIPIAALANFSMHYFGDQAISSDYFGLFCDAFEQQLTNRGPSSGSAAPVAIMSHGCSGDIWKRDYLLPAPATEPDISEYTQGLLRIATQELDTVEYRSDIDLAMQETRLQLNYRVPDAQRLAWSEKIVEQLGDQLPQTQPEIYAREQIYLHQMQSTEIVLQAIRIGDIAICTTPNETYALTGLKLKHQSPLEKTMVIELANGGDGYIPPPEQHFLGGYNTWPARSAGLEVNAEPKIVANNLLMLEAVCAQPRRQFSQPHGIAAQTILESNPVAYWRLEEMSMQPARDSGASGGRNAFYEPGVIYFLDGPNAMAFTGDPAEPNRCAHFAGGRMRAELADVEGDFSIVMSFWNGMPLDAREIAGWMFSRDEAFATSAHGIHLGLTGAGAQRGRLRLQCGEQAPVDGVTAIERWTWGHVALIKSGNKLSVYLNDEKEPEIECTLPDGVGTKQLFSTFFFGGRSDNDSNWEGKLDEIAVFPRALNAAETQRILSQMVP